MNYFIRRQLGFSLIEVSIALLLASFLMLALFQSYYIATKYRLITGKTDTFGLGLTNTLQDLASDTRGITVSHDRELVTGQGMERRPEPFALKSSIRERLSFRDTLTSDTKSEWANFVGHHDWFAFRTSAYNARFSHFPDNGVRSGDSLVVWWLADGSPKMVEAWRNKHLPIAKSLNLPNHSDHRSTKGLIRTQFFLLRDGGEEQASELIDSEFRDWNVRYYDGKTLRNEWDSDRTGGTPCAIAIELSMSSEKSEFWIELPTSQKRFE